MGERSKPQPTKEVSMSSKADSTTTLTSDESKELGPWGDAFATLEKWDPRWAETCLKMTTNPWTGGVPTEACRADWGRIELRLHQPRCEWPAPSYSRGAPSRRYSRRDSAGAEDGVTHVH